MTQIGALRNLQTAFHRHLLGQKSTIAGAVAERAGIDTPTRLSIYHNAYRQRLLEALRDSFEKTRAYLGDERFDDCALAFIDERPPSHRSVRWYGAALPDWLGTRQPDQPDIGELAVIDWQMRCAFDGANATALAAASLHNLDAAAWETLGFVFAPTLCIVPLRYNTLPIWHALDRGEAPPPARALAEPTHLLVWRKGLQPHFRSLASIEHSALDRLRSGATFAAVCAALQDEAPGHDIAAAAGAMLRQWLDDELIVALGRS